MPTDPLVLEAVQNDGAEEHIRTQWTFIHNVNNNSWVRFKQVPVGVGYSRFRVIYGSDSAAPRHLEVRLDSPDGPLAGRIVLPQTDRPRGKDASRFMAKPRARFRPQATGTRDVVLVFQLGGWQARRRVRILPLRAVSRTDTPPDQ